MRSTFTLAPGSMPAPLGRRFKDRSGQVLVGAAPDGSDVTADRPPVYRGRRVHDLAVAVRQNLQYFFLLQNEIGGTLALSRCLLLMTGCEAF